MSVVSGMGGAVNGVSTVRGWSIDHAADLTPYVASGMKGGTSRVAGNKDWTGQYTCYGHSPTHFPGDAITFTGSIDGSNGCTGAAMVNEVTINWDIEAGGVINYTVSFEGNGALTFGASVATDVTVPSAFPANACKIELADVAASPSYSEVDNIRTITLTFTKSNPSYASSGTAGLVKRVEGNLDCSLSYGVYEGDPTAYIQPNTVQFVRVYVNATTYWEIKAMRFGAVSGVEVDIEGPNVVGATQNAEFEAFYDLSGTMTEGVIINPAVVTKWP